MGVGCLLRNDGAVLVGAPDELSLHSSFALEDIQRGLHGGIGELRLTRQTLQNLLDISRAAVPEHAHNSSL
jgi:hypothetical protein